MNNYQYVKFLLEDSAAWVRTNESPRAFEHPYGVAYIGPGHLYLGRNFRHSVAYKDLLGPWDRLLLWNKKRKFLKHLRSL